jgi:hypothetical protein
MPDPQDPNSAKLLAELDRQARAGFSGSIRDCWDTYRVNEDFFGMRNLKHLEARESETPKDFEWRPKQFSRMTRRAVRCLTNDLYSPGPTRKVEGSTEADSFLQDLYEKRHINALMQRADRKATLNGTCAVQVVATGNEDDPESAPLRLYLWGRDEFHAFAKEDDPCCIEAVVTWSVVEQEGKKFRRYEVWTAEKHRVYETKPVDVRHWTETSGGTAAQLKTDEANEYGCVPFAFVHNELPVDTFGAEGIGTALREANAEVDRMLSDLAELIQMYTGPKPFIRGVPSSFRFNDKAGRFQILKSTAESRDGDSNLQPDPFYLQPEVNIESTWFHIREFANNTFQDLEVPIEAVRGDLTGGSDLSGVALAIKWEPLKKYVEARQPAFAVYETDLAKVCLRVAGTYYQMPGLVAASEDLSLTVEWPERQVGARTVESDQLDANDLADGLQSRIGLLMQRRGYTRQQAIEHLKQLAKDRKEEEQILGPMEPPPQPGQPPGDPETPPKADPNAEEQDDSEGDDDGG